MSKKVVASTSTGKSTAIKDEEQTDPNPFLHDIFEEYIDLNNKNNLTEAQKLRLKELNRVLCKEFVAGYETDTDSDDDDDDDFGSEATLMEARTFPMGRKRSYLFSNSDAKYSDEYDDVSPVPRKLFRSQEHAAPLPVPEFSNASPNRPRVIRKMLPANTEFVACPLPNILASRDKKKQEDIEKGRRELQWIIDPIKTEDFYTDFWEKNIGLVLRKNPNFYTELISFNMIEEMLHLNHLDFTTDIDVTSYKNGKFEKLNPEGRAEPEKIWSFYRDGCSTRILNPCNYLPELQYKFSLLKKFFQCSVDINAYLTPPKSQGYAPHVECCETFVLQIEGRMRWRLYMPPQPINEMNLESSGNYRQEELGRPIMDKVLKAGDFLYFPRGVIHQAVTEKHEHSLHITLSVYQKPTYVDLMEFLMPHVFQRALGQGLNMRLPLHTDRDQIKKTVKEMFQKHLMPTETEVFWGMEQLAKKYQHDGLPKWQSTGSFIDDQTSIRLLRSNIVRMERNGHDSYVRIYRHGHNDLNRYECKNRFIDIEPGEGDPVELLINSYPDAIKVSQLPLKTARRRIEVAKTLFERGLLMYKKPKRN